MNEILESLRSTKFPKCSTRKNVASGGYEGFCLGEVNYRGQAFLGGRTRGPSSHNAKHERLFTLLKDFIQQKRPRFSYTTIQINKNVECLPHVDANNVGSSYIIALGDFTGGELVVEGNEIPVKNRLVRFDGRKGHWTNPFKGERYSIIYFTHTFKPPTREYARTFVSKDGLFINNVLTIQYPRRLTSTQRFQV